MLNGMDSGRWACDGTINSYLNTSWSGAGSFYVQYLNTFLAAQCALVTNKNWPPDRSLEVETQAVNFDFIVVGAGSAGSVVANRLSANPSWKVLLIEAGGNPTIANQAPRLYLNSLNHSTDWSYLSTPQENACLGHHNRSCTFPRGKVLGGSSAINGMAYVRGNKLDFDAWAAAGNTGWAYEDVLPYFKKSEDIQELDFSSPDVSKYHSQGGNLYLQRGNLTALQDLIQSAYEEIGIPRSNDINGPSQMGSTRAFVTIKNGIRQSTANAFLSPIKNRTNLYVMRDTLATKIILKNKNAIGVTVEKDSLEFCLTASKEVILSAGAINTPQLLMLSGIGPKEHLTSMKIPVVKDLPVGKNLQEHVMVPTMYKFNTTSAITVDYVKPAFERYILNQTGDFSTVTSTIITFFDNSNSSATVPNSQTHNVFFAKNASGYADYFGIHSYDDEVRGKFLEINKDYGVYSTWTVYLTPNSTGEVLLQSKDPKQYPLINPKFFSSDADIKNTVLTMKKALQLADTKTFKNAGYELFWLDLEACRGMDQTSDKFYECMARRITGTMYHPVGTAKMGPKDDGTSVVDPSLKVFGIGNLRVMDACIFPDVVRGNTNAATIMVAEKGADLLIKDWQKAQLSKPKSKN